MKYNLDPSLKKSLFSRVKPPFNKLSFFFSRVLATIYPFPRKLKKILSYKKINVKEGEDEYKVYIFHKFKKDINSLTPIFYLHGGAFAYKGSSCHFKNIMDYALNNDVVIYYLDYDTKLIHPKLEEQVEKAFLKLKLNPEEIILAGDSAGGYLALSLFEKLRKVKALMLFYPVVTNSNNFESKRMFYDTPMWNAKLNELMWKRFLNSQTIDNFLSVSFDNLPKTYVEICEFDCLKDEGVAIAKKFNAIYYEIPKAMHGFDIVRNSPITINALINRNNFIRKIIEKDNHY